MGATLMNKPLGRAAMIAVTAVLLNCQSEEAIDATQEASTLGSMDEQYAWVGDLGDRDALPGKALYIENCAGCHEAQVYKA
jgi:cytochrome c5